ncbi:MAG TPA: hypothetical protein VLF18_13455 [Tahibacter sp.]|uniref:hypothetical protein n=1 Tax=Tahibacter sp. TaxID=2056211 RepID=UPI002CC22845|nr:hypothetical protein [Tahibacter sp.]HSX61202.1 hypothetical protein [Tahibacter sp.]
MKTTAFLGLALLTALPATAATQPEFLPLAGAKDAAHAKNGPVMRSPLAQTIPAPIVSQAQAVPTADGGIQIKCSEVPNPRLRDTDARDQAGPRQ